MLPYEGERNVMIEKMKTDKAKEIYKIRGQTVEPVFGDIKENKGLSAFLTRGIEGVRAEFNIICAARNLKRIWAYLLNNEIRNAFSQINSCLRYLIEYFFYRSPLQTEFI